MGQTSNKHYRVGESSDGDFLSPAIGTFTSPIKFLPYMVGIFGLAFLASCITASIMTPVQNSDATTGVSLNSNAVSYFVNIASATNGTAGVISKDIQATYAGTLGTIEDQLRITSNTPQGYKVYVSMNGTGETAQRLVNTTDSSYYLKPIEGNGVIDTSAAASLANPGTLSANSWGVAVNSAWNSAFDSTYTNVTQNSRFAPVPVKGAEELLITQDDTTTTETQTDNITVYYGYHANSALPSGTYQNTVLYTAYAEATDQEGGIATYTPDGFNYKDGGEITFTTSLYTDRTVSASDVSVTIGDKTCDNIVVSKVGGGNDSVTITCDAPAQDRPGDYPIAIDIDRFAHHSRTSVFYDTDGITIGDTTYKTMQSFSNLIDTDEDGEGDANVCSLWAPTPAAFTGETIPLDEVDEDETRPYSMDLENSLAKFINQNVPETTLQDIRDNKWYLVRKLADGNCRMMQNLDLDLSTEVALMSEDTDLNSIASWTPAEDTQTLDNFSGWSRYSAVEGSLDVGMVYSKAGTVDFQNTGDAMELTGNYYSLTTATAGRATINNLTVDSICPAGWKITFNSYYMSLLDTYGLQYHGNWNAERVEGDVHSANMLIKNPLSMSVFNGRKDDGVNLIYRGSTHTEWVQSNGNSGRMFEFGLTDGQGITANGSGYQFGIGSAIRCVAQ
ncbi:MAG: hypothetical protein Q4E46_01580 [Candidatus Saccharibacteria bacterium]|nr:hypothetical protein [Candidatus Saccharibacteria bacterium]